MGVNTKILKSVERNFGKLPLSSNRHFILAVSGGPDSQCLLKAFPHIVGADHCIAVGIDHGLRPEAPSELRLAEKLADSLNVPFYSTKIDLAPGSNLMARARDGRYAAIRRLAETYLPSNATSYVVTAHHFDDRAETVLFRLLRGKGLGSLGVLPELSGDLFRPMLKVTKEEILAYNNRFRVESAQDPSNQNTKYSRVKLRKEVMPELKKLNPQIVKRLNEISDEILELQNKLKT